MAAKKIARNRVQLGWLAGFRSMKIVHNALRTVRALVKKTRGDVRSNLRAAAEALHRAAEADLYGWPCSAAVAIRKAEIALLITLCSDGVNVKGKDGAALRRLHDRLEDSLYLRSVLAKRKVAGCPLNELNPRIIAGRRRQARRLAGDARHVEGKRQKAALLRLAAALRWRADVMANFLKLIAPKRQAR